MRERNGRYAADDIFQNAFSWFYFDSNIEHCRLFNINSVLLRVAVWWLPGALTKEYNPDLIILVFNETVLTLLFGS